jgi:hypothetical protein
LEDAVITQEHKDRNKQDDAHGCPGQLGDRVGSRNRSASTFSARSIGKVEAMDQDQSDEVQECCKRQEQRIGVGSEFTNSNVCGEEQRTADPND